MVGNEFFVPQPRMQMAAAAPVVTTRPPITIPIVPDLDQGSFEVTVHTPNKNKKRSRLGGLQPAVDFVHRHSLVTFALLFLLVGSSGIQVAAGYRSAQIAASVPQNFHVARSTQPHSGINMSVPTAQLTATLQKVTSQAISFTIDNKAVALDSNTIKGWLQIVTDQKTRTAYLHVKEPAISASLQSLAQKYSKAAVNQVSVDHGDGSGPRVISPGSNGLQVSVPDGLAKNLAKNLFSALGLQAPFNATPVAFQAVTPAAFSKMIEVNLTTKQMYLYQNGQFYKSYLISAGKPSTPTPVGQFKIFSKYPVEDMWGYNANGTKYFQPHVYWINYFLPGGYAIHGVYWHGSTWFGNINSSHGCVGLPDAQAQEVYNWAPIGTTVITHL